MGALCLQSLKCVTLCFKKCKEVFHLNQHVYIHIVIVMDESSKSACACACVCLVAAVTCRSARVMFASGKWSVPQRLCRVLSHYHDHLKDKALRCFC